MGEPAVPTPAEREETLALARAEVEAIRNDEPSPLEHYDTDDLFDVIFRLAQDLVRANEALKYAADIIDIEFGMPITARLIRNVEV